MTSEQESIQRMYTEGNNGQSKYLSCRQLQYPEIDDEMWNFFGEAHSKNIPVNGPMLLAEANEIAIKHNYDKFCASNGWLQRFSTHHQINLPIYMENLLKLVTMPYDNGKKNCLKYVLVTIPETFSIAVRLVLSLGLCLKSL